MRPVRIAYVVSAYKNPGHLSRLVHRLHTGPDTSFLLHVDSKTDEATHRAMREGLDYVERGLQAYEQAYRERQRRYLQKCAAELGLSLVSTHEQTA